MWRRLHTRNWSQISRIVAWSTEWLSSRTIKDPVWENHVIKLLWRNINEYKISSGRINKLIPTMFFTIETYSYIYNMEWLVLKKNPLVLKFKQSIWLKITYWQKRKNATNLYEKVFTNVFDKTLENLR